MNRLKKLVKQLIVRFKNFGRKTTYPIGHFYSPIVNKKSVEKYLPSLLDNHPLEINLNTTKQVELLEHLQRYYKHVPFEVNKNEKSRYYYNNVHFSYADAILLFCFLNYLKPKKIIEVGSGFSSAVMLDTNDMFPENKSKLHFIEPYPQRLFSLFRNEERQNHEVTVAKVQDMNVSYFEQLEANDLLFIDSTHVSKTGSDVNYLLFEVIPRLKKGVIIHFHDIFYPFEYPKKWIMSDGFGWNEDYILKAFLMYNSSFEILLFNSHIINIHQLWFENNMPLCLKNTGGSLYLRKCV
jgi:predicted O-methyltransferase YrrM